jgi:hypothetical protein
MKRRNAADGGVHVQHNCVCAALQHAPVQACRGTRQLSSAPTAPHPPLRRPPRSAPATASAWSPAAQPRTRVAAPERAALSARTRELTHAHALRQRPAAPPCRGCWRRRALRCAASALARDGGAAGSGALSARSAAQPSAARRPASRGLCHLRHARAGAAGAGACDAACARWWHGGKRARTRAHLRAAACACFAGAQGKKDVQDARASATDERLPVAVRRRKGRDDLEAEHKARARAHACFGVAARGSDAPCARCAAAEGGHGHQQLREQARSAHARRRQLRRDGVRCSSFARTPFTHRAGSAHSLPRRRCRCFCAALRRRVSACLLAIPPLLRSPLPPQPPFLAAGRPSRPLRHSATPLRHSQSALPPIMSASPRRYSPVSAWWKATIPEGSSLRQSSVDLAVVAKPNGTSAMEQTTTPA